MQSHPLLSSAEVTRLLSQKSITDQHPWGTEDAHSIEGYLKGVCAAVVRLTQCKSKVEWNHYGSGYASFVDAWFYRTTPAFNATHPIVNGEGYKGLVVLFSCLSPYFVFMEGEKHWHDHGGSSYLPDSNMVDRFESLAVSKLAQQVQTILEDHGLIRVLREQLTEPLGANVRVPTVLTNRGFTQFDALYYWED